MEKVFRCGFDCSAESPSVPGIQARGPSGTRGTNAGRFDHGSVHTFKDNLVYVEGFFTLLLEGGGRDWLTGQMFAFQHSPNRERFAIAGRYGVVGV